MFSLQRLYDLGRPFWFGMLGIATLAFFVTDCLNGRTEHFTGHISGHDYTPPYTTASYWSGGTETCTTTKKGDKTTRTCRTSPRVFHPEVYHPPRWYMVVSSQEGRERFEITEYAYQNLQIGKAIPLQCQVGCYTGWHYSSSRE